MHSIRIYALWAVLLAPAAFAAEGITSSGTIAVSAGGALLNGDRPAFQQLEQQRKDGFGGIEEFRLTREGKTDIFRFDARLLPGNDDYRVAGRYELLEKYYIDAGFEQFRVFYDGSGGYFRPTAASFVMFPEDLSLARSKFWVEGGVFLPGQTLLKARWERRTRDGTKSSTHWTDTNLVGAAGTRNIVPSFYDIDEVTDVFTVDLGNDTQEDVKWNVGTRYSKTELDNKRNMRRRPFEAADRIVTQKDETKNDIFTMHGYYLRKISEQLTVSGGAMRTSLDSHLAGSRIYGQSYDPVFDPAYARRQQRDEGFYDLEGDAEIKQTVLNLNAVYVPKKNWSVRPSLRFENRHQETMSEFVETNIGAGPAFGAIIEEVEGESKKDWNEIAGAVDVRFTGIKNWTFNGKGEWVNGSGEFEEERTLHTGVLTIDREQENTRTSQKYSFTTNWYPKAGMTVAAQYYFKTNQNDYDARRDNTPAGTADRYPAFISDQDFETNDFNIRVSWRPAALLGLVTRYDHQQSKIISQEVGLQKVQSSKLTSHIISQSVTWSPSGRLFLNANVNLTYDTLETPAFSFVKNGDNNYINGAVGGGYALAKLDDLYVDYNWFNARNFIDTSASFQPYGVSQKYQGAYVTWVRRQSEHLIYTLKYGYVTNRDDTWAGLNNFDAHVIYGKVQYRF